MTDSTDSGPEGIAQRDAGHADLAKQLEQRLPGDPTAGLTPEQREAQAVVAALEKAGVDMSADTRPLD